MKVIRRHKRLVALASVAALVVAGTATAYWTQGGTGNGSAASGTTSAIVVKQTAPIAGLFPGGPAQTLAGNFDNPNAAPVFVANVTAAIAPGWSSQSDPAQPACTASDFAVGGSANVNAEVGHGVGVGSWSGLTIAMVDTAANQDNCKNVTVTINYTSN